MSKYSFEFKKQVVQAYLNGEGGWKFLVRKYAISSTSLIRQWVAAYQKYGDKGLLSCKKQETYSFDFKLHVVQLYLATEVSYQELALVVGINNPSLISKWVNTFRLIGPDALKTKPKGRSQRMDKANSIPPNKPVKSNDQTNYIKQLENQLLKLEIENAYLKELRRLRLEGTPQNKKRESSIVSEDRLN